jgi:hypothetical protein
MAVDTAQNQPYGAVVALTSYCYSADTTVRTEQGRRFISQCNLPQKHRNMATMTAAARPTTAPLRYRVSCLIAALFALGNNRLGVNVVVGARLVADTALLFDAGLLVEGGVVDVRKLADGHN